MTLTPANFRQAWIVFTVGSPKPDGDQVIWGWDTGDGGSGDHATALTLRFKWDQTGTPTGSDPNFADVSVLVPGGAAIGATWAVAFPAADTEVTRVFHLDDDPLSTVLGALRSGTVELFLDWGNSGGLTPWNADSRGGGTPAAGNSIDNARGYARSRSVLLSHSISNVAIAGAEPGSWAFPDPVHTRVGLDAVKYRAHTLELELLRDGAGAIEREQTLAAQTPVNHDYSWTGTTGTNRRVGNGMFVGSELKDLRVKIPALDFGGDNEYVFAATGHEAGWVRDSDLQLTKADRITVDPRLTVAFLSQPNNSAFATPPLSLDKTNRLTAELVFQSARFRNARAEGSNLVTATIKNWDVGELTGSEASPVNTASASTSTQGGEAGWMATGAAKLPLAWDESLPGGGWPTKVVVTAPTDATGLEIFGTNSTRTHTLLAIDPDLVGHAGFQVPAGDEGDHAHSGDTLKVVATVERISTGKRVSPDAGTMKVALVRYEPGADRIEFLDTDGVLKHWSTTAVLPTFALTETPVGSAVFQRSFVTDATWSDTDLMAVSVRFEIGGTPYQVKIARELVSVDANAHDGYKFDGVSLAIGGLK